MEMNKLRLLITTQELQELLSCGRRNAEKVGRMAKAEVSIGNLRRWNMDKIREFLYKEAF